MRSRLIAIVATSSLISLGLFAFLFPKAQAALSNILVKAEGPAIYYIGDDGKRYVFPNEKIYQTWYADFSQVQKISASELASHRIGGNVTYRPGSRLIKITSDATVYAVGFDGDLYPITSEQAAIDLFGQNWQEKIDDLNDSFFANYQIQEPLDGSHHQPGSLLKNSAGKVFLLVETATGHALREISAPLQQDLRLDPAFINTFVSSRFSYAIGEPLTPTDEILARASQTQIREHFQAEAPVEVEEEAPSLPAEKTKALLNFGIAQGPSPTLIAVHNDPRATLLKFTIEGDAKQDLTIKNLAFTIGVDTGGDDPDFLPGSDEDDRVLWAASQLIHDLAILDSQTGKIITSYAEVPNSGNISLPLTLLVKKNEQKTLELVAKIALNLPTTRIAADFNPSTGLTIDNSALIDLEVSPQASLNPISSPGIVVVLRPNGKLELRSKSTEGDRLIPLGQEDEAYIISFKSISEDFIVSSFDLALTNSGKSVFAIEQGYVSYTKKDGTKVKKAFQSLDENNRLIHFSGLEAYIPKNGTVDLPITLVTRDNIQLYSNSRIQLKFLEDNFSATGQINEAVFSPASLANAEQGKNQTSTGPLLVYRQSSLLFANHPDQPAGTLSRFKTKPVLIFSVQAQTKRTTIRKMTFKIEASDAGFEGSDNDLLEIMANELGSQVTSLFTHHAKAEERTRLPFQSYTLSIYDKSQNAVIAATSDFVSGGGDYGLMTIDFGGSAPSLEPGSTYSYDFDVDTTLVPNEGGSIKVTLLGDEAFTPTSQANFLWDDGSNISATGYLIGGLSLSSGYLNVDKS